MSDPTLLDAAGLRTLLEAGRLSAVEIAHRHADRVRRLDGQLNAFLRLSPRLERDAESADRLRADGKAGPLTGIPVAIKDNICTAGIETTCASEILRGFVPARDATAVARLRHAGAVVLGKTNLDEFGMGSSTESSAAGPTRNPWDLDRVPGGSSGGSAVALAARFAPLALGSDTGGSVRQPAALCGTVGVKPTYGRVSRSGLVAFGSSLDQIGPMARSVADAALLLQAIAGADPADATCSDRTPADYAEACGEGVEGLRVGLPREYLDEGLDPEIAAALRSAADRLAQAGADVETVSLPHTRFAIPAYYLLATSEASSNLARYDAVRYGRRVRDIEGLASLYRRSRGRGLGAEVQRRIMLGTYALSAGYHDRFYGRAQRARALVRRDFVDLFRGGVQLLLTPPTPSTAFRLGEKTADPLEMYLSDIYTTTANLAGIPGLVLPVAISRDGLPIGCQLLAPHFEESLLFRAGGVLEIAFPGKMPPWVHHPSSAPLRSRPR